LILDSKKTSLANSGKLWVYIDIIGYKPELKKESVLIPSEINMAEIISLESSRNRATSRRVGSSLRMGFLEKERNSGFIDNS